MIPSLISFFPICSAVIRQRKNLEDTILTVLILFALNSYNNSAAVSVIVF